MMLKEKIVRFCLLLLRLGMGAFSFLSRRASCFIWTSFRRRSTVSPFSRRPGDILWPAWECRARLRLAWGFCSAEPAPGPRCWAVRLRSHSWRCSSRAGPGAFLSCNCIGVERVVTSYPFEVAWRLVLFFLMLILLWDSCRKGKTYFNVTRLDFSEM